MLLKNKQNFVSTQWGEEKYKWEAVKCFLDNWDVNAADFGHAGSFLVKNGNLLASKAHFPAGMIEKFAQAAPEKCGRCSLTVR
jgi:5-methylcytosine-specific restriction protein B